jgi:hypothetical protein
MHPNELQDPPAAIELVETVSRDLGGRDAEFLVFRYRMPEGHWASGDWILGLSGPFYSDDAPYSEGAATPFSRASDKASTTTPAAIVDELIRLVGQRHLSTG